MITYTERAIDRHFADFMCRQEADGGNELFRLLVGMASNSVGEGHSCLDLSTLSGITVQAWSKEVKLPNTTSMIAQLKQRTTVSDNGEQFRPLVVDDAGRFYLYRYWRYEQELAKKLLQKLAFTDSFVDTQALNAAIERLFPEPSDALQKDAARMVVHSRFAVISGGPGTGKTSTVVRILALLLELEGSAGQRIAMAAPTGKAAARLQQSVNAMRQTLDCADAIKAAIPDSVVTIQRLLGAQVGSHAFRYSAHNPLPYETVIVDEASMVALPLMSALVAALKPEARLVLLGDKDQLASVEAGAVLGDICHAAQSSSNAPLARSLVVLKNNYRFSADSGIAALSHAVNDGDAEKALALVTNQQTHDVVLHPLPQRYELAEALAPHIIAGFRSFLETSSPQEALLRFDSFRILSALREGAYGTIALNALVEQLLAREELLMPTTLFYHGRPIMITVNDYALQLFNGDIGLLLRDTADDGELKAFFQQPDGSIRALPPERLPQHETTFAMTIHKSQGSEFEQVLMLLPSFESDLFTRELVYTAITRAKQQVDLWADETQFVEAIKKKTVRRSGLRDALCKNYGAVSS